MVLEVLFCTCRRVDFAVKRFALIESCIPSRLTIPRPFVDALCKTVVATFCSVTKTNRLCVLWLKVLYSSLQGWEGVYLIVKGGKYSVHVCTCLFPSLSVTNFPPQKKEAFGPQERIIYTVL